MNDPIRLVGATASPYSQKMVALLRYRRMPYAVTWGDPKAYCESLGIAPPRPVLLPTFLLELEGEMRALCDSTPIIRHLEAMQSARSVLPSDPALAFVDYLIEDFADEWGTKYMFHYRWHAPADADNAGTLLPLANDISLSDAALCQAKAAFSKRQVDRLYVVGSNELTAPIIDASYRRFLRIMERHLAEQPFMFGRRPSAGDFALYGQLSQLVGLDPTPRAIAHELAPRVVAWVGLLSDQSGLEPSNSDWLALEDQPTSLRAVLEEIGRVYAPAQLANARAVASGESTWQAEIDGAMWSQPTFAYQAKCLRWTLEYYQGLSQADRQRVDQFIAGTGVETMLALSSFSS